MARIDTWFIRIALIYLLAGMAFGIWMGISKSFNYSPFHAHVNLVGFALMTLFGLIHRAWPELRRGRLSAWHFWLHNLGTLVFVIGLYIVNGDPAQETLVIVGSLIVLLATILFAILFYQGSDAT